VYEVDAEGLLGGKVGGGGDADCGAVLGEGRIEAGFRVAPVVAFEPGGLLAGGLRW
jgi:hypothetical protein